MALEFKIDDIAFQKHTSKFLQIGAMVKTRAMSTNDLKTSKNDKVDGLWGTLGWANDKPLTAKGKIQFSEHGSETHRGVTEDLAQIIMDQNPDVKDKSEIRQRFINLSDCEFQNVPTTIENEEELHLRFDLFLEKDEGALVYLQDNPKGVMNSKYSLVNLITPEATPNHTQDRNKLTYLFAYSFGKELVYDEVKKVVVITEQPKVMPSVLKILTFKRKALLPREYAKQASIEMNKSITGVGIVQAGLNVLGKKKYKLFKYNENKTHGKPGGKFDEIDSTKIDVNAKTLFLLHGTFSSVDGSYGELCLANISSNGKMVSPFQKLISEGVFEQIIGFNHPTASHSVDENVKFFFDKISGKKFTKPVGFITTSRGALVAETIFAHPTSKNHFTLGKAMTFAPAHGSDLLKIAKGLDRFLSFLKSRTSSLGWGYVIALAQFSIKAISTQPGLNDMLPNSAKVKEVIASTPIGPIAIQAMVGDFHKSLISKPAKRILANGADALIRLAFKSETDWVIGCPEQKKRIKHANAQYRDNFEMLCIHGMQFTPGHPKKDKKKVDMTAKVEAFFK